MTRFSIGGLGVRRPFGQATTNVNNHLSGSSAHGQAHAHQHKRHGSTSSSSPLYGSGSSSAPSSGNGNGPSVVGSTSTASNGSRRRWPLRAGAVMLRGPGLLLRAPTRLLLATPRGAYKGLRRAGMVAAPVVAAGPQRLFGTSARARRLQQRQQQQQVERDGGVEGDKVGSTGAGVQGQPHGPRQSFTTRLRQRWSSTETRWYPIPISLGAALLVALSLYKKRDGLYNNLDSDSTDSDSRSGRRKPVSESQIKVQGPWQVHVIGALPLRSISRIYGMLNSFELPVWFRTPGYRLYAWFFGVNLDECEPSDLREYRSMSEFFMRRLKDGVRPIADTVLVSPSDGKVVNFGVVEGGRVEQVKGSTYSLEALLNGTGPASDTPTSKSRRPYVAPEHPHKAEPISVNEEEFANINDISYSLDELMGNRPIGPGSSPSFTTEDASLSSSEQHLASTQGPKRSLSTDAKVALEVSSSSSNPTNPKQGHKLFFTVVYLAPGDYHRYHSPTNWVVEKRRHFAGELFSVSPWMAAKLQDLFVLNERVALLGRWKYGFFSMTPVGATNVGSIRVNFDSTLRTNSPLRPITPGTFSEATYAKASTLLGGQPLRKGDEVGGFWLGSTIVLVFEAPEDFEFMIERGEKVKMGQALGEVRRRKQE
ncbi:BQ5605_C038g11707 [Microbotryum silenes-dioicae]|uniref:Phosphatidylserine decarboxylase proenzyme 1, mitochondrial n=1 Tax=Microbotryum silenes-dioicae TaxID=796604 RepID=A0A2X0PA12_9BASI|nr:BQ5605_C038g11707 [Microbotryum silenes-dioicae]